MKTLLASPESGAIVTTMIDLSRIPADFPGLAEASNDAPDERVRQLERRLADDIGDRRFIPYLQLHEFEALLLTDVSVLVEQHPNRRREITELAARLERKFDSPEHVNRLKPPSYWIKESVPEYNKTVDGSVITASIGLRKLRERCPHFAEWLGYLEDLVASATPRQMRSPD